MLGLGLDFWKSRPAGGPAGLVVDLWQTFDVETLTAENLEAADHCEEGSWAVDDDEALLSLDAASEFEAAGIAGGPDPGISGLRYNCPDTAAASARGTVDYTFATSKTNVSFGFWFRFGPSFVALFEGGNPDLLRIENNSGGGDALFVKLTDSNQARIQLFTPTENFSGNINVAPDTLYWITGVYGPTHHVSVYLPDGTLVGTQSLPGSEDGAEQVNLGVLVQLERDGHEDPFEFDDLVLDWSNAVFPILPPAA